MGEEFLFIHSCFLHVKGINFESILWNSIKNKGKSIETGLVSDGKTVIETNLKNVKGILKIRQKDIKFYQWIEK